MEKKTVDYVIHAKSQQEPAERPNHVTYIAVASSVSQSAQHLLEGVAHTYT